MANILIFSCNRASQLELFIRSMKFFFKEFSTEKINILYTYSNDNYKLGYDKLISIHNDKNINYIKETNFKKDLLNNLNKTTRYTTFFVDDNVFKEEFSFNDKEYKYFDNNKNEILCLSLRLHPNLTYCYPARINQIKPNILNSSFNVIDYIKEIRNGDFGYPFSLDGHIFLTRDILEYLERLDYNNPNSLESQLAINGRSKKTKMIFYDKSRIFNIPINKVQTFNNNIFGNVSAEYLNEKFLNNEFISLEELKHFENISAHQEVKINFIK
jgi:hypothetical protein